MTLPKILAATAALAATVTVGLVVQAGQNDPARRPSPPATPATVSVQDPGVGQTPAASADAEPSDTATQRDQPEPEAIASAALTAFTEYSWRDATPTTWAERTAALFTPRYGRELAALAAASASSWDSAVTSERRSSRTEVKSVVVSGMHENTPRRTTYTVTYYTAVQVGDEPWTQPVEPLSHFVTVVATPGGWKVDRIVSTADRS